MFKVKFDHVISIGEQCGCAMYLNRHRLRYASYPFDWLDNCPFSNRITLITNNLEGFLLEKNTEFYSHAKDPIHEIWIDKGTQFTFAHDFEKNCVKAEAFPQVKAKYDRRIARFYRHIREAKHVLLVWWGRDSVVAPEELLKGQAALSSFFGKPIHLLAIQNDKTASVCREEKLSEYVLRYVVDFHMYNYTEMPGVTIGDTQMSDPIFSKIRCAGKGITLFRHTCANIVSSIIPFKSLRRSVRKRIRGGR